MASQSAAAAIGPGLPGASRFEILPMGGGEADAARLDRRVTVTVTCSPRHGIDHSLDVAERVQAMGHDTVVHLAARAVHDRAHLDRILERVARAGMQDLFVIGGDAPEPAGQFGSATDLLEIIAAHPARPRRLGVGAYPEGHPLIDTATLDEALTVKSAHADYLVTQLCFDPEHLLGWLARERERGIALPAYIGIPGAVDRRKLMEISMRVGVGASVSFLRKQHGLARLFGRPAHAADGLKRAVVPLIGDPRWGIAGFHHYTFNRLVETCESVGS